MKGYHPLAGRLIATLLAFPLAAFFIFVGWNKTFAALEELRQYGAWTIWLPEALGRAVGLSEILCAVLLLGAVSVRTQVVARTGAVLLILNQLIAALFHAAHGEIGALPQNAILSLALIGVIGLTGISWKKITSEWEKSEW